MGTSKNKTRQTLTNVAIHKPMKEWIELRDGIFVSLENGYIIPATPSTVIEGIAINDIYKKEQIKEPAKEWFDRMCIYLPKRRWETFTMDVENGEITQEDVGQTFLIIWELQHINYNTKAERGWQFRLEQVITPTRWEFTYYFDSSLSPQWPKGEDGETPTFTFSPVQTLPVGSDANLIVDAQWNNYDLTFQIPAWANGKDWKDWKPWPKWPKGDTIDLQIGQVTGWQTAAADIRTVSPTMRELDLTLPRWEDWEDGLSPTPRDNWNSARTYTYLDIVRYPDQDGVGCTWIWKDRNHDSTSEDIPWESDNWMLLVRDGADGEQGEPWGTIVVPVEWKPWKDGAPWEPWDKWNDGKSPHNEWEWNANTAYTELAMVRASTGEFDPRGNEIFWYYITQTWVPSWDEPPKDNPYWQLLSKDGMAWDGNRWTTTVLKMTNQAENNWSFDGEWNGTPTQITFDALTGNREMATSDGTGITITKTWHYQIVGHLIVQNNTSWQNMYANLWRMGIHLSPWVGSGRTSLWIGTAKSWWAYATKQWPRLDLTVVMELDLYEWDRLTMYYRAQTDTSWAEWTNCSFTAVWATDASGDVQTYLWWLFSTYLWVKWLSKVMWQGGENKRFVSSI